MAARRGHHQVYGGERTAGRPSMDALGESEAFVEFQARLSLAAKVDRPVLLIGERGSGKELAAARLHYLSPRWEEPFVALNCSALAPSVLESELFGHEAGAFTGATKQRSGRFEAANGGTLFLDEIGLIPIPVQEKILRVVEYGAFERVGSSQTTEVDVRIIGATNADLPARAAVGEFKQDLLDRLAFEVVYVPPLRIRQEDIMLLATHFAARIARELGRPEIPEFSAEAIEALLAHDWPGNIRELKNTVERAVYRSETPEVTHIEFDPFKCPYPDPRLEPPQNARRPQPAERTDEGNGRVAPAAEEEPPPMAAPETPSPDFTYTVGDRAFGEAQQELEVTALRRALSLARYHQGEAAERLGLSYHQFRSLYRKHKEALQEAAEEDTPDDDRS